LSTLTRQASSSGAAADAASPVADARITVCLPFCGDELGGSHVSARGLLEGLDQRLYRTLVVPEVPGGTIATFFSRFEQAPDPARPGRPFLPGHRFGAIEALRALAGVIRRARFLRAHAVQVVHSNDGRSHASWAIAAWLAGARLVWHHRGDPEARGLRYVAPLLADQVLTVSQFALPRRPWGSVRAARVVYSPFDTTVIADRAAMRARIRALTGCAEDAVLCGYFGNFIGRKRPLAFVEAVERLGALLDRPVVGVMFGDERNSEVSEALPARIAAMDVGSVHMMGYRAPGHDWLAGCDLLLVPAEREPLGRTLVEAMLVGTLVVATDSGGNGEALADGCGVLCPLGDAGAMARAAAALLGDPDRARTIREKAARQARLRFSRESHVRQVADVYTRLAGKPG
jgi:glycosyltransferase involved in cell wall biosynthesis